MKLIATFGVLATLLAATAAQAQLIPIAIFPFNDASELTSFTKTSGDKCSLKLRSRKALGINLGEGSTRCVYRTSVVADSSDKNPSQDLQAAVGYEAKTPEKLRNKLYASILVRAGPSSGYELRLSPAKQRWIMIRDPEGPAPESTMKAGTAKFIRPGAGKLNTLRLITTGTGESVGISALINNKTVFSTSETTSSGAPAGRFMELAVGNKTGAVGTGMLGTFDNVTIRIARPF